MSFLFSFQVYPSPMGGLSIDPVQSCVVRTVKCEVKDDFDFDDNGWGANDLETAEFWKDIGLICLWPFVTIVGCLILGILSYAVTGLYLNSATSSNDEKSEAVPKTLQSAEKSDYVDANNVDADNLEFDRDGIYDFEHTITFGPIRSPGHKPKSPAHKSKSPGRKSHKSHKSNKSGKKLK